MEPLATEALGGPLVPCPVRVAEPRPSPVWTLSCPFWPAHPSTAPGKPLGQELSDHSHQGWPGLRRGPRESRWQAGHSQGGGGWGGGCRTPTRDRRVWEPLLCSEPPGLFRPRKEWRESLNLRAGQPWKGITWPWLGSLPLPALQSLCPENGAAGSRGEHTEGG